MSLRHEIYAAYSKHGARWLLRRAPGYVEERVRKAIHETVLDRFSRYPIYWTLARQYVALSAPSDVREYETLVDPYGRLYVDPSRITKKTHRHWKPFPHRKKLFGKVKSGTWDRSLIRLRNTDFYNAFVRRFEDGAQWSGTHLFKDASNRERLRSKLQTWEQLHEDLTSSGYRTQEELLSERLDVDLERLKQRVSLDRYYREMAVPSESRSRDVSLLRYLLDEVLVDVGRNRELLLVDGKHRLCLAQLLGLDEIPVTVAFRHREWMEYQDELYRNDTVTDWHPDLRWTHRG